MPKHAHAKAIAPVIGQVFVMYSNLLTEEVRQPWTKIVKEQIDSEPWMDLCRIDHPEKCTESWVSFME